MSKTFFWIIVAIIIKQILWIALIPIWQFPDEQAHFAQVQNYAEGKGINNFPGPTTSREIYESEKLLGTVRDERGDNKFTYHPEYKIDYSLTKKGPFEKDIKDFPASWRQELVIKEASGYPPLYYVLSMMFYLIGYREDLITRIFLVRLFNIILSILFSYIAYLISKELFDKNKIAQLTLLLLVLFHPMFSFVSAGINSDNLYNLLFTVGIYICLRSLKQGLTLRQLFLMTLTFFVGTWVKPQSKLLVLLYTPIVIRSFFPITKKKIIFTIFAVTAIIYLNRATLQGIIAGDQFLPDVAGKGWKRTEVKIDFVDHLKYTANRTYRQIMPWYWGVYRWLSFTYPRTVHRLINLVVLLSSAGLIIYFIRALLHKSVIAPPKLTLFLIYSCAAYFLAITVYDYFFRNSNGFSFGIQGRYFFPLIIAHMSLLLIGFNTLINLFSKRKFWILFLGLAMVALHSFAFYWLIQSYYANTSLADFFTTASQYKPEFFKSPFLEVILVCYIISLIFAFKNIIKFANDEAKPLINSSLFQ